MKRLWMVLAVSALLAFALIPFKGTSADHTEQKANWSVVWHEGTYGSWRVVADGWIVCEFPHSKSNEAVAWARSHSNRYAGLFATSATPTLQSVVDWLKANRPQLFAKDIVPVQLSICVSQPSPTPTPTPVNKPPVITSPRARQIF